MTSTPQVWPDAQGRYGPYGGSYVPETLMAPVAELTAAYEAARKDPKFVAEWDVRRPCNLLHGLRNILAVREYI